MSFKDDQIAKISFIEQRIHQLDMNNHELLNRVDAIEKLLPKNFSVMGPNTKVAIAAKGDLSYTDEKLNAIIKYFKLETDRIYCKDHMVVTKQKRWRLFF